MPWLWLLAGAVLAVAEVFTTTFVLIMFAAGAFAAAIAAAVDLPIWLQALVFAGVSAGALVGVRPVIRRHLHHSPNSTPIGLAAIEGSDGLVLEQVDADRGLVKIGGEMWSARPYDATQVFEVGTRVRVIEIRGATALVWKDLGVEGMTT
jgi:membrane protein implicated in regulation of membrane protease activity